MTAANWTRTPAARGRDSIRPTPPRPETPRPGCGFAQAIAKLDGNDREVLLLREYEELSYEEIAGVLRVPLNTVRSRLFRARLALKEILVSVPRKSVRKENALDSSF